MAIRHIVSNTYSTFTQKLVTVNIVEEWCEEKSKIEVATTIPTQDKSLNLEIESLIKTAKNDLKIITPYIDMSLILELSEKLKEKITIKIVTRTKEEFTGSSKKETFDHLQRTLKTNHKANKQIHSRIIIKDEQEAIVSSADLTYDSLVAQYNVGILINDPKAVSNLLRYFFTVWKNSN